MFVLFPEQLPQRLGIFRKFRLVFHNQSLLVISFRGFVLPVLDYCCAVWCSTADIHILNKDVGPIVVSGACFLPGGMLDCTLSHRRSAAV